MKLREITKDQFMSVRKYTKILPIIEEFVASGCKYSEVDYEGDYKTANYCAVALRKAVRRSGYSVEVAVHKDQVFLENTALK